MHFSGGKDQDSEEKQQGNDTQVCELCWWRYEAALRDVSELRRCEAGATMACCRPVSSLRLPTLWRRLCQGEGRSLLKIIVNNNCFALHDDIHLQIPSTIPYNHTIFFPSIELIFLSIRISSYIYILLFPLCWWN